MTGLTTRGPNENDHSVIEPSCRNLADLVIIKSIVNPCRVISFEDLRGIGKIQPVMGKSCIALGGIESDFTGINVFTSILPVNNLVRTKKTVIVAQAAERLVSSCTLAIVPNVSRGGRPYAVIENVVTHADYRQLGLGRRVLAHALDLAWEADCYKALLATGSKRESTLRFYEGAGFERGGKAYFEVRRP